ncbi:MAG: hypothetical protein U0R24_03030 [Solirubrobacterales bacterium]
MAAVTGKSRNLVDLKLKGPKKAKRGKVVKVKATITNPGKRRRR